MGNTESSADQGSSARTRNGIVNSNASQRDEGFDWERGLKIGLAVAAGATAVGMAISAVTASKECETAIREESESETIVATPQYEAPVISGALFDTYEKKVSDQEFQLWKNIFMESLKKDQYNVIRITKVKNPKLEEYYGKNLLQLQNECYAVDEKVLFHGTKKWNIKSICQNNFRIGEKGVFFASKSTKAVGYTGTTDIKAVIIVKVMIGNVLVGSENGGKPPVGYDTRVIKSENVYVKFDENTFLPMYVVYFKTT